MSDYKVAAAMETYGGSFVKALAHAWYMGDSNNKRLIKETWPVYWARYTEIAKQDEVSR
jgi:hypothetical protein